MLAEDGYCKTFDARADGFARGEGLAVALVRNVDMSSACSYIFSASSANQDGASGGITVPNGESQKSLLISCLHQCSTAEPTALMQTHGTGTSLGDPIEYNAIVTAYTDEAFEQIDLTASKASFGHLEASSGLLGLCVLRTQMSCNTVTPHLHICVSNPQLDVERFHSRFSSVGSATDSRHGRLSSFGVSGTNAHVFLSKTNQENITKSVQNQRSDTSQLLPILPMSAKSEVALLKLMEKTYDLAKQKTIEQLQCNFCLQRDTSLSYRACISRELFDSHGVHLKSRLEKRSPTNAQSVVFLYTGYGSETLNAAKTLYQKSKPFRDTMNNTLATDSTNKLDIIYPSGSATRTNSKTLHKQEHAQPVLFAIESGMTELLSTVDIAPHFVSGHSTGEIAAATAAGILSLEGGASFISKRGDLYSNGTSNECAMLAYTSKSTNALSKISVNRRTLHLEMAAKNSTTQAVLAGRRYRLEMLQHSLRELQCQTLLMSSRTAAHSSDLSRIILELWEYGARRELKQASVPMISSVSVQA